LAYTRRFLIIVLAYFLFGKFGLSLSLVKHSVSPIWPPTGFALAVLLLFGLRYSPAILAGAFLVNLTTHIPAISLVGISIGNTLEAVLGTILLRKAGFQKNLAGVQDVLKLLLVGACISTLASASIGSLSLLIGNVIGKNEWGYAFWIWWLGDMTGDIWVAPIILVIASQIRTKPTAELGLIASLLGIGSYLAFQQGFNYTYALFPMILWGAMRFTTLGAAVTSTVLTTIAILMTAYGHGPFQGGSQHETLALLNLFIGSSSLTAFIVAAVINDLRGVEQQLEMSNQDLEKRVEERTITLNKARIEAVEAGKRERFMAEASAVLSASLEFENTLNALTKVAVPFLADCCIIDVLNAEGKAERVAAAHILAEKEQVLLQLKQKYIPDENSFQPAARVIRSGKPELLPEITDEIISKHTKDASHFQIIKQLGIHSHIAVPMISGTTTIGAINLGLVISQRKYTEEDLLLAQEFAKHASLAVQNSRLFQDLQNANRVKDEFLATVSHELRTPLTVILGWAKTLEQIEENVDLEIKKKALRSIARSAELQAQIVDDLLDLSRVRTGKFRLQLKSFLLPFILNNALDAVRPAAAAKGIEVSIDIQPGVGIFYGDPDRLQQIFWNLLSNAVKFTEEGGKISLHSRLNGENIEIAVADTGKGIAPEFQPHLFERFRQADSSYARKYGGLGLGLALSKHFVELHGGSIGAQSDGIDRGATFTIRLPRPTVIDSNQNAPMQTPATRTFTQFRVLMIDDDPATLELLEHVLDQSGFQIRQASSATKAMQMLKEWVPDLLICDIGMPEEDGYSFIKKVRAFEDERFRSIPAVALTAYATPEDEKIAISAGFQVHVKKPIDPLEFRILLESFVASLK
jgi:signal transduction histidine kinase/integral membrane sensor domain MASE1/CheY-like chemotaxis protein